MKKLLTLVIVHQENRVLLGMKKRGFGAGKWNGFGGKVHEGESIEQAAKRELREEVDITTENLEHWGVLEFHYASDDSTMEVHVFRTGIFSGEPSETEEMRPQWFDVDEIPFDEMWPDDRYWLPLLLAEKKFSGRFSFDEDKHIIDHSLSEII